MLISIIIPARNAEAHLGNCLQRLSESTWQEYECIVVDDASDDGTSSVALSSGAHVLRQNRRLGPGECRNLGALAASASVLLFLDADTLLHRGALELIASRFTREPELDAFFGSYDEAPAAGGVVSRFRNLLHCFTHQNGKRLAGTFWSGCGAIRKEVFNSTGGFSPLYNGPEIEDVEFGYRLRAFGRRVELDPRLQTTHLKKWNLLSLLYTDICNRGIPWTLLALRTGCLPNDLATRMSQRFSVWLTLVLFCAVVACGFSWAAHALWLAAAAVLGIVAVNLRFFRFLQRTQGWGLALAAPPLQVLFNFCCLISIVCGLFIFLRLKIPGWTRSTFLMKCRQIFAGRTC